MPIKGELEGGVELTRIFLQIYTSKYRYLLDTFFRNIEIVDKLYTALTMPFFNLKCYEVTSDSHIYGNTCEKPLSTLAWLLPLLLCCYPPRDLQNSRQLRNELNLLDLRL